MKIGVGIAAILLGIFSLLYVGLFGSMIGSAAGWLGSLGPGNSTISNWASVVSALSWLAPLLAITGGIVTFSNPRAGGAVLAVSAFFLWYLLGFGMIGNLFVLPIGAAALLAFFAAPSTSKGTHLDAASATSGQRNSVSTVTGSSFDRAKWNALLEYDSEVASAAEKLRPLGAKWIDELAHSYLALNEKTYLPGLVNKISIRAKAEADEHAKAKVQLEQDEQTYQEEKHRIREARREQLKKLSQLAWGTQTRRIVTLSGAVLLLMIAVSLHFLLQPARVEASAVWSPDDSSLSDAYNCPEIICLVGLMEQHHATKKAVDFARELSAARGVPAWALSFYKFGAVDMVAYDCGGVACEYHGGFALVNGSPRIVLDTSELKMLQNNPEVQQWISRNNNCCFVTRYYGFAREFQLQDGTQRFVFANEISQCEACRPLAGIEFAFDFNHSGTLVSKKVLDILPSWPPGIVFAPGH